MNYGGLHLWPGKYFSRHLKHNPSARRFWSASADRRVKGNGVLFVGGVGSNPVVRVVFVVDRFVGEGVVL